MKKTTRLSESDLKRIISRVVNESINDLPLYRDIMTVLSSSNASIDEKKYILRMIINEMNSDKDRWSQYK